MARYVMGIDAGGTKTRAVIGDMLGNIIYDKTFVGISHNRKSNNFIEKVLQKIYTHALHKTKLGVEHLELIFLGLSGADTLGDYDRLTMNCLSVFQHERFIIDNDAWIVLRSGTTSGYGAVCISGTGANSGAININNKRSINRSIGFTFGTYGGGLDIAREALHYIFRADELSWKKTSLTEKVLKRFNLKNIEELVSLTYPKRLMTILELGSITLDVFEAAKEQDEVAIQILTKMGKTLGHMTLGNILKLEMENDTFTLVLGGSVFKGESPVLINSLKEIVLEKAKNVNIVKSKYPPVIGAYLYALDNIGIVQTESIDSNIRKSLEWLL